MVKKEKSQRIAHMTRYLHKKMTEVRKGRLEPEKLIILHQKLLEEKALLERYNEEICEYLGRENTIKGVNIPNIVDKQEAAKFTYPTWIQAQDMMFIEEFYMYSKYEQQRPESLHNRLGTGVALLQACIYDLSYAIKEVELYITTIK